MKTTDRSADTLLSAQVVTAEVQLVTANTTEHADLFWGLRGGGGNFGVVVSLEYRLHPLTHDSVGWPAALSSRSSQSSVTLL